MEFPVTLTPEAVKRIVHQRARDARPDIHLRLGVKGGGCSGFEYLIQFETRKIDGDLIAEFEGVTVRIDPKSAEFLSGSTLTYTGNLIGGGLKFENPNAERACGCGSSFTPKDFS